MTSNSVYYWTITIILVLCLFAVASALHFSYKDRALAFERSEVMRVLFDKTTFGELDYLRFYDCQTNSICFVAGGDISCVTGSDVPPHFSKRLRGKCNE